MSSITWRGDDAAEWAGHYGGVADDRTQATTIETEGLLSIPADWHLEHDDDGTPSIVITLDFGDLEGAGGVDSWQFAGVTDVGSEVGTDLTLRYIPNG